LATVRICRNRMQLLYVYISKMSAAAVCNAELLTLHETAHAS